MNKIVSASLKEDLFGAGKYYLISKTKHQKDMWHVNGVIDGRLTTTYLSGADLRTLASRGLVKLVEQPAEQTVEKPVKRSCMMFRKKPVVVEAKQWIHLGHHPHVEPLETDDLKPRGPCKHCGGSLSRHGWIKTLEGGHIVCPGDWIITGVKGEHYPCKPNIFWETYEPVERPAEQTENRVEEIAKLSERKTVHEWLNEIGIPVQENGRPLCLLRRLRIACDRLSQGGGM